MVTGELVPSGGVDKVLAPGVVVVAGSVVDGVLPLKGVLEVVVAPSGVVGKELP